MDLAAPNPAVLGRKAAIVARLRAVLPADAVIDDPARSLLGPAQEAWLFDELTRSKEAGTAWLPKLSGALFKLHAPWSDRINRLFLPKAYQ